MDRTLTVVSDKARKTIAGRNAAGAGSDKQFRALGVECAHLIEGPDSGRYSCHGRYTHLDATRSPGQQKCSPALLQQRYPWMCSLLSSILLMQHRAESNETETVTLIDGTLLVFSLGPPSSGWWI
ncbi:Hypothetical protein NTJ_14098 [Nesidiocoris tenuis]|uniref:Uncharacterized protein n=1 Tax=Nesidiocoris tenuis TaxID=355587 RepID=A0ABN7BDS1_9HEMI|nr:Hypothetical protein NTJ_14098 [Nesidiocoris tenuis]